MSFKRLYLYANDGRDRLTFVTRDSDEHLKDLFHYVVMVFFWALFVANFTEK